MNTRQLALLFGCVMVLQGVPRHQRSLINLFSDHHQPVYRTGDSSPVIIGGTDGSNVATAQNWMNTLHKQTNRIIEGAGEVVMTPVNIITHMKEYW